MSVHEIRRELWLPLPPEEVFPFFADACNLEKITPDFLRFRVVTPTPIEMRVGTLIDYRLRLHGLPIGWRTEITKWNPPFEFCDIQLKGPYRRWEHTHQFIAEADGTRMIDRVFYELPFGPLGDLVHLLNVRRDVEKIFDYRNRWIAGHFGTKEVTGALAK